MNDNTFDNIMQMVREEVLFLDRGNQNDENGLIFFFLPFFCFIIRQTISWSRWKHKRQIASDFKEPSKIEMMKRINEKEEISKTRSYDKHIDNTNVLAFVQQFTCHKTDIRTGSNSNTKCDNGNDNQANWWWWNSFRLAIKILMQNHHRTEQRMRRYTYFHFPLDEKQYKSTESVGSIVPFKSNTEQSALNAINSYTHTHTNIDNAPKKPNARKWVENFFVYIIHLKMVVLKTSNRTS